jgi:uncharacterized membrane protein
MINVLPHNEKELIRREYWMRFFSVVFVLLSLASLCLCVLLLPSYFLSTTKESLAQESLLRWNREHGEQALFETSTIISETNQKLVALKDATPSIVSESAIAPLLALRTSGITFSHLIYNTQFDGVETLEVRGTAETREALRVFKQTLDESGRFASVEIPLSSFIERSNIPMNISIVLK